MIEDEFSAMADDEYRAALIPLVDKATRPDDATPIACTLPVDALPARIEDWAGMLRFVTGRSSVDGGSAWSSIRPSPSATSPAWPAPSRTAASSSRS